MENEKLFEFMTKMYAEMQQGFKGVNEQFKGVNEQFKGVNEQFKGLYERLDNVEGEVKDLRSDVKKLGAKIDGEISDKLKILSEEQSIMREDILEIKEVQSIHSTKIDDLTMAVNNLSRNQREQEKEIWELRKVK